MKTTYDEVWTVFLNKCKIDDIEIPTEDQRIYETIRSASLEFNNRLEKSIQCNDEGEQLSEKLSDNELLLFAHCIRLIILENQMIYFTSTYSPFTKELGVRHLGSQINRLKDLVEREDDRIRAIILKTSDDFL